MVIYLQLIVESPILEIINQIFKENQYEVANLWSARRIEFAPVN